MHLPITSRIENGMYSLLRKGFSGWTLEGKIVSYVKTRAFDFCSIHCLTFVLGRDCKPENVSSMALFSILFP